jgi:hypothetical protein
VLFRAAAEALVAGGAAAIAAGVIDSPRALAVDPSSARFLADDGGAIAIFHADVDAAGKVLVARDRASELPAAAPPDEALFLDAVGRVVGLQHVAGQPTLVTIEGSPAVAVNRDHMIRTVGDAVVLFGCVTSCGEPAADNGVVGAGHDVLIAP